MMIDFTKEFLLGAFSLGCCFGAVFLMINLEILPEVIGFVSFVVVSKTIGGIILMEYKKQKRM